MSTKLTFLGGVGTVTGSRYLLEVADARVLIDCGLFQGFRKLRRRNWDEPPFDQSSIDAVVLTHAHIDHSGYLPVLGKNDFSGRIICTEASRDLCAILLPDSGHLRERDAEYVTVDPHLHRRKSLAEIYTIPTAAGHSAPAVAKWIAKSVQRLFVIVDDIASSAHTMMQTVGHLGTAGFPAPICVVVHGKFAGEAYRELLAAGAGNVVSCNTIPHQSNEINVVELIADAVRAVRPNIHLRAASK